MAVASQPHGDRYRVVLADIDEEPAVPAVQPLDPTSASVGIRLDVANPPSVAGVFAEVEKGGGGSEVLVNDAGVAGIHPFLDYSIDDRMRVFAVNVVGAFLCGQQAARGMVTRGSGRIVNIASVSGIRASVGRAAYGASKAVVTGFTRQMAIELAAHGRDGQRHARG